ncbi:MAG: DUF3108 domain-containing protein [Acidobacteria bacterium]|nr:DUF3108 domain-containing protein [Acidobacteriota bacterium]
MRDSGCKNDSPRQTLSEAFFTTEAQRHREKAREPWRLASAPPRLRGKCTFQVLSRFRTLITALAPALLSAQTAAPPAPAIRPAPPGYTFPDGERLVYQGEWRLFNAGTATLEISPAGGQQHVHGVADSSGAIALLYRVSDRFDSWFDSQSLCSSRILKHTEEGRHRRDTQISFDYEKGQAVLEETNLSNNEHKRVENAIPGCVTDVISAVFYGGTLPLAAGDEYSFPLNDGNKTVNVMVHVEGREDIKTPAGAYHTVRVRPEASAGPLRQKGKIWVWYTDDAQHTPVQIRARMFWGNLTLSLLRSEHISPQ